MYSTVPKGLSTPPVGRDTVLTGAGSPQPREGGNSPAEGESASGGLLAGGGDKKNDNEVGIEREQTSGRGVSLVPWSKAA